MGPWLTLPVMLSWGKKKRISSRQWGTRVAGEEMQVSGWQRGAQLWAVHAERVRKGRGVGVSLVLPKGLCIHRRWWHSRHCWREHGRAVCSQSPHPRGAQLPAEPRNVLLSDRCRARIRTRFWVPVPLDDVLGPAALQPGPWTCSRNQDVALPGER